MLRKWFVAGVMFAPFFANASLIPKGVVFSHLNIKPQEREIFIIRNLNFIKSLTSPDEDSRLKKIFKRTKRIDRWNYTQIFNEDTIVFRQNFLKSLSFLNLETRGPFPNFRFLKNLKHLKIYLTTHWQNTLEGDELYPYISSVKFLKLLSFSLESSRDEPFPFLKLTSGLRHGPLKSVSLDTCAQTTQEILGGLTQLSYSSALEKAILVLNNTNDPDEEILFANTNKLQEFFNKIKILTLITGWDALKGNSAGIYVYIPTVYKSLARYLLNFNKPNIVLKKATLLFSDDDFIQESMYETVLFHGKDIDFLNIELSKTHSLPQQLRYLSCFQKILDRSSQLKSVAFNITPSLCSEEQNFLKKTLQEHSFTCLKELTYEGPENIFYSFLENPSLGQLHVLEIEFPENKLSFKILIDNFAKSCLVALREMTWRGSPNFSPEDFLHLVRLPLSLKKFNLLYTPLSLEHLTHFQDTPWPLESLTIALKKTVTLSEVYQTLNKAPFKNKFRECHIKIAKAQQGAPAQFPRDLLPNLRMVRTFQRLEESSLQSTKSLLTSQKFFNI